MRICRAAVTSLLVFCFSGCAAMQKPWGSCALGGAAIGGAAVGIAGGVMANNDVFGNDPDGGTRAAAIGGGIVSGAILGALAGHLLCDGEAPAPVVAAAPPPPPPPAPLVVLTGSQFAFNSATLTPGAIGSLTDTLDSLKTDPELQIRIDGHTDSIGSTEYNLGLSARRADAVKRYLVSEGIAPDRIETRGLGKSSPVADNATEEGRARNRRVEVYRAS